MKLKLFVLVTLSSFVCQAADPDVTPVKKGEQVPFSGVLLSPEGVAKTISESEAKVDLERVKQQHTCAEKIIRIEGAANESKIRYESDISRANVQLDSCRRMETEYLKRIEELEKNKPNVWSWFWVGATGAAVLTGLTFFAISSAIQ